MLKKLLLTLIMFTSIALYSPFAYADEVEYTVLRPVDVNTFNEYRYRITEQYIELRNKFEVNGLIDTVISNRILVLAKDGLNYLPDNLINTNYYNSLKTSIERGILFPENSSNFQIISTSIENYLSKTNILKVSGSLDSFPSTGNAPLTVTLRSNITDPSGTKLETYNYTWWINDGGKRKVIGNRPSLNYVFNQEGNYSVFLDVTSNHKNSKGFNDVLPFSSRADIEVKEKIASLILKVNGATLGNMGELKFTPDESKYGLLFDATSSTPTSGTRFTRTEWDFGNGLKKVYDGGPKTERIVYASEGEYTVTLTLRTNEGKTIERKFTLRINNPIATISSSQDDGYLGDNFTFSANTTSRNNNLTYSWRIIDIKNDKEIFNRNSSTFTYSFAEKGVYNVMLYVTEPSGQIDIDTKIIYINSRPPVANFTYKIPYTNNPNTVFLDGTSSYDPDFSDDGKLKFSWIINGNRVNLDRPNFNGSNGYFTFSSLGDHSVVLEVTDPDEITDQKSSKVIINSILSVDFNIFPRVSQREKSVRFVADSPSAQFYEWDFGDGKKVGGKDSNIAYTFNKSGVYNVKLKVIDSNDNENTINKNVYIGDTNAPYAFITLNGQSSNEVAFEEGVCSGEGAYIVNRVDTFNFSGSESLDITGETRGLSYSWKLGNVMYNSENFTKKFDELGCVKARLVVKSDKNGREASREINIKVENIKPKLAGLDVRVRDTESDPVIVTVSALGAEDRDGIIQSYLWYYYTDLDPEPQDFRATRTDSTSFVLPKITGNYYFVVVMKDNNETRSNSEEITGSKYFITLTGDNINTPLLDLKVNNSSVGIGDEVVFTANAENILGQNLNSAVKFSWDFDGDGFYDKETSTNTTTHVYLTSGEKFARVKVSYKGFSNTKTLTVNVANILKPDFDYVSIGNEYAFFDLSLGAGAIYEWNMGDGNIVTKNGSFKYTYEDGKNVHLVKLKLTEGTKVREITKRVVRDMSNIIKSRQDGLVVFSNHKIENDIIYLKEPGAKLYFYLGTNSGDIANYVADFDIEYDSSLSGGTDDDENNKNQNSYYSGDPILIDLNNFKEQKVRLYTKGNNGQIISSRDIKIVKEYLEDGDLNLSDIIFVGVSESVRLKLEKIKNEVNNFPKEHKLKGLMYIQRLKDEWNDNREKTNIILEFSNFIDEIKIPKGSEIIDILESLLIDGDADRSEKAIAFNALKNLIPVSISCLEEEVLEIDGIKVSCYELLVTKLEIIGENSNIDENVELGKQILRNIAVDQIMTVKEKNDFKAILNTFVYGGVSNIPEDEKQQIIDNDKIIDGGFSFLDVILFILKIIFYIILVFSGIIILFFGYYKVSNKDKSKSFADFIGEKTSGKSNKGKYKSGDDIEDIFSEKKVEDILSTGSEIKPIDKEVSIEKDPFSYDNESYLESDKEVIKEEKVSEEVVISEKKVDSSVPDWLKGSFSDDIEENPPLNTNEKALEEKNIDISEDKNNENFVNEKSNDTNIEYKEKSVFGFSGKNIVEETEKKEEKNISDSGIPDWLKGSFSEDIDDSKEEIMEETKPIEEEKSIEEIKEITKELPEKPSIKEVKIEEKEEESKPLTINKVTKDDFSFDIENENFEPKLETKEELDEFTKIELEDDIDSDTQIPDWLKGSISKDDKSSTNNEEIIKNISDEFVLEEPNNEIIVETKKTTEEKPKPKKTTTPKTVKKDTVKEETIKKEVTKKADTKKTSDNKNTTDSELWDDGMKVPDWLQTDDDKK